MIVDSFKEVSQKRNIKVLLKLTKNISTAKQKLFYLIFKQVLLTKSYDVNSISHLTAYE